MTSLNQTSLLIISQDVVGAQMAGPGIRYFHLARVLAQHFPTTLAIPDNSPVDLPTTPFALMRYTRSKWASLAALAQQAQVILLPSDTASEFPQLAQVAGALVIDGYDPLLIEWLALNAGRDLNEQMAWWRNRMKELAGQFLLGDFYLCASERQRDWWIGLLEAHGRLNPATFAADPSLRKLIDVVPYGLAASPPQHTRPVIKGVWPGIAPADKLLLWGGGLWPWLDPLTAIRAVGKLWPSHPELRLVFPGTKHPNPSMAGMPTWNVQAQALAAELGLLDRAVFFGDWVGYADWQNVLLESDVALTLHFDMLETRLAFRSRLLEYIWAAVPVVATRGDATSELVHNFGIGLVVEYADVAGVAAAIEQLLAEPTTARAANFAQAQQALTWERAVQPLVEFCHNPRRAADRALLGENLGNPAQVDERARLQRLVQAYANGRVMRLLNWLNRWWQRL
jgi:glycosyltransferase involved in cell wall biosynthesis